MFKRWKKKKVVEVDRSIPVGKQPDDATGFTTATACSKGHTTHWKDDLICRECGEDLKPCVAAYVTPSAWASYGCWVSGPTKLTFHRWLTAPEAPTPVFDVNVTMKT